MLISISWKYQLEILGIHKPAIDQREKKTFFPCLAEIKVIYEEPGALEALVFKPVINRPELQVEICYLGL